MNRFKTKKSLGQHFLNDDQIALQIVEALQPVLTDGKVIEIGPGLGVLTKFLIKKYPDQFYISEIDDRILKLASTQWQLEQNKILAGDFLRLDLYTLRSKNIYLIGNFPYNISSQIVFHLLKYKDVVVLAVGMFQREMAKRITAKHGNKDYGVICVLTQAYYTTEYLFEVTPDKFSPPPKVHSAVIKLQRKNQTEMWNESLLRTIVKTAFNQRRKKLSNALASVEGALEILKKHDWEHLRAEQLSVEDYIQFTLELQHE
ncbi:MAG: 16S rRNA (adenine(1518)-N(6)/adenine(1519)-N(6))-dimethyltransferase RsmA [Chitinophagales bacterium]